MTVHQNRPTGVDEAGQKGEKSMADKKNIYKTLTEKDISEGKKLSDIFSELSEVGKSMAISYLSALRDKELAGQKVV